MPKYDVAVVRDYYPSNNKRFNSSWVHNQVKLLIHDYEIIVLSPTPFVPNFLKSRYYYHSKAESKISQFEGIDIIRPQYLKLPNLLFYTFSHYNLSNKITKTLSLFKPKLVHAHFGQNGSACVNFKEKMKIPLVTSFYGYDSGRLSNKFKTIYSQLIQKGDLFLSLSKDMKNDLINLNFPSEKIVIHHLGVDVKKFKSVESNSDIFTFLIVSRFTEGKGIRQSILAFKKLLDYKPKKCRLIIIGGGSLAGKINHLINSLNLNQSVSMIDNFSSKNPREVVRRYMRSCDVFMLNSYQNKAGTKEGTPVVLMEAQACSKPCISTRHAGIPEVVIDQKTGFLVDEKDIESIKNKMILLINNDNLRKKMGRAARKHIVKDFNQDIQTKKLSKIYKELLNN